MKQEEAGILATRIGMYCMIYLLFIWKIVKKREMNPSELWNFSFSTWDFYLQQDHLVIICFG